MSTLAHNLTLTSATQFLLNLSRENSQIFSDSQPHSIPSVSLREASYDETHLYHFIKEYEMNPLLLKETDGASNFNPYYLLAKKVQELSLDDLKMEEGFDLLDSIAAKSSLFSSDLKIKTDQHRQRADSLRAALQSKKATLHQLTSRIQALSSGHTESVDPLAREEMELDRLEIMITKLRNATK